MYEQDNRVSSVDVSIKRGHEEPIEEFLYISSDVKSKRDLKSLKVDPKINEERVSEKATGHFGNNSSTHCDVRSSSY
jgi:hypothetical protein